MGIYISISMRTRIKVISREGDVTMLGRKMVKMGKGCKFFLQPYRYMVGLWKLRKLVLEGDRPKVACLLWSRNCMPNNRYLRMAYLCGRYERVHLTLVLLLQHVIIFSGGERETVVGEEKMVRISKSFFFNSSLNCEQLRDWVELLKSGSNKAKRVKNEKKSDKNNSENKADDRKKN